MAKAQKDQTHCKRGHEFTSENTHIKLTADGDRRLCRACEKQYQNTHREEKRTYLVNYYKTVSVKKNLEVKGWTEDLLSAKLQEQEGRCAICSALLTQGTKGSITAACADHEHSEPPKPRGVLCPACNVGLGNLKDSIELLEKAIAYLKKYA